MLELVLTKADLSGLTIVDSDTVVDSGSTPAKAYTLENPGLLDAPGVCQTLAAVSVLENYEYDTKVSYISYVENGTLHPANIITGSTVAETKSRLEMVIRETTKPLDIINVKITRADCERVKLHSGKLMWEKTETADDIQGFTLTTKAGATFTANVPEYLRMPLFRTQLDVVGLAATALTLEELSQYPANAIVDGVCFDLPDTELDRASLVPNWFYIGVYHPVRVSELMVFLDGYLRMFTPHTVSADEIEQEARIKATAERLLKDWK